MSSNKAKITNKNIEQYELLVPLLHSTYGEIKELSKKKPDGSLNEFKVKKINRILKPLNELMQSEPIHQYLDIIDEETLPFNSDVVLVLREYIEAARLFSEKYTHVVGSSFDFDINTTSEWNRIDDK